jgi:outer membrane autotransporter protein
MLTHSLLRQTTHAACTTTVLLCALMTSNVRAAACPSSWNTRDYIDASCTADTSIDWTGGTIWVGYNGPYVNVGGSADPTIIVREGQNVGSIVLANRATWNSLINHGEMSSINIAGFSRMETFINLGHIRSGIAISGSSRIGTVINLGTIATSPVHPDLNVNAGFNSGGTIENFINAQSGLTLGGYYDGVYQETGRIPTNYFTYFSTPSSFGTIHFKYLNAYNLSTYGLRIAANTNYVTGTYAGVITADQRVNIANLEAISGIKYKLVDRNGDGRTWDLVLQTISPTRYSDPARSWGNSTAVAAGRLIENNGALSAIFDGANLITDQQINAAVSQSLPLFNGAGTRVARGVMGDIGRVVQSRLDAQRGLSSGDDFLGNRQVWMKYFGSWARQDDRESISGFKTETNGMTFGTDRMISDSLRLGAAFSYAQADVNSNASMAPQNAKISLFQLAAYGNVALDDSTDFSFQLGAGTNRNKSTRRLAFVGDTASARYDSLTLYLGTALSRAIPLDSRTTLTPSLRADYTRVRDGDYQESGAGLLNLSVQKRTAEQLLLGMDAKLNYRLDNRSSLSVNAGIAYDALAKQDSLVAAFAAVPDTTFIATGMEPKPWSFRGGMGYAYTTDNGAEINLRYDADVRQGFLNQTASVKARWMF